MSKVTIIFRGDIASAVGTREAVMEASTVRDVLLQIKAKYGKEIYKNAKRMLIAINGTAANRKKGYATKLKDGDVIKLFPICGGG